jgi:MoxR-like ATPase
MDTTSQATQPAVAERVAAGRDRILSEIRKVIVGQDAVVEQVLIALFTGGHCLITGVPGLAKTLLIKTLAEILDLSFKRIQFTPDLMPADITGTEVLDEEHGHRSLRFVKGPIFAQILLADEINRTPPKTQAALLEAMQEYQVTVGGVRYPLERPLFVLATENPIEQEGTHPLPEAQLDRFMLNVVIHYPGIDDERRILAETTTGTDAQAKPVATGAELEAARQLVRDLPAASNVVDYALRIIRASRPMDPSAPKAVTEWVRWGAGPRAGQALILGAKAAALLDGRTVPSPEDVRAVTLPVLRHRVLVNFQAEADGVDPDQVIGKLLDSLSPRA